MRNRKGEEFEFIRIAADIQREMKEHPSTVPPLVKLHGGWDGSLPRHHRIVTSSPKAVRMLNQKRPILWAYTAVIGAEICRRLFAPDSPFVSIFTDEQGNWHPELKSELEELDFESRVSWFINECANAAIPETTSVLRQFQAFLPIGQ